MKMFGDGPGQRHWVPGHEEIELALVKLADATGKRKYLDFAYWLLSQRGHGYGCARKEQVSQFVSHLLQFFQKPLNGTFFQMSLLIFRRLW